MKRIIFNKEELRLQKAIEDYGNFIWKNRHKKQQEISLHELYNLPLNDNHKQSKNNNTNR